MNCTALNTNSISEYSISNREQQVLKLIAHEYTSLQIAEELYISKHTVDSHRKRLMQKLKANNTAGLIRRGFEIRVLTVS